MRLATIRTPDGLVTVRVDGEEATDVASGDVATLLSDPDWRARAERATGPTRPVETLDYAPLVATPRKIICIGLNYRSHILEMGHDTPDHPTLFAKYPSSLVGAYDDIVLPRVAQHVDWEVELGVVIGTPARHVSEADAVAAIAGYTVVNDISVRDWQYRTTQWLQGKTFESSTPVGPHLVTLDELGDEPLELRCEVDGEQMQAGVTSDLVFGPAALVSYISEIFTLEPGDLIATGTPSGVGHGRTPPRYLADGSTVVSRIERVGECRNRCRAEQA